MFFRSLYVFFVHQRIEQRIRCEAELRQRIEQLEKRQTQDDAVLNVVNRYWNQLNEDIRVLLQRFDAETADEAENRSMSPLLGLQLGVSGPFSQIFLNIFLQFQMF